MNDDNPRECQDNLGTMVCFHRRYKLGDEHGLNSDDFNGWDEVESYLYREHKAILCFSLYLYDHGSQHIKIGDWYSEPLPQGHARFDSGQVGYIYTNRDAIRKFYNVKRVTLAVLNKAKKQLELEVQDYEEWMNAPCDE